MTRFTDEERQRMMIAMVRWIGRRTEPPDEIDLRVLDLICGTDTVLTSSRMMREYKEPPQEE